MPPSYRKNNSSRPRAAVSKSLKKFLGIGLRKVHRSYINGRHMLSGDFQTT